MQRLGSDENVLLIDDDADVLDAYRDMLATEGFRVRAMADALGALELVPDDWEGIVITDIFMPGQSGMNLLDDLLRLDAQLPVLLFTGHGDVPMAIDAVRRGAFDFLGKPVDPAHLLDRAHEALRMRRGVVERRRWQRGVLNQHIIGRGRWVERLRVTLRQLAETDLPLFFHGESGTGRSTAARYVHQISGRKDGPLTALNAARQSLDELIAAVGASAGGTLLLRNCDHLDDDAQRRLVQMMEDVTGQVRLIATGQKSASTLAAEGRMLPSLYGLFSLTQVEFIPLRERSMDIADLFDHYLARACLRLGRPQPRLKPDMLRRLTHHPWPGNIHELAHAAELCAVGFQAFAAKAGEQPVADPRSLDERLDDFERTVLAEALKAFDGRINEVAEYLKVPRKKLYLRMKKYGLDKSEYRM